MCKKTSAIEIRNDKLKKTRNSSEISDCDIYFIDYTYSMHIYQGSKCLNDIRLRYKIGDSLIRTPKHMHWLLDLILKKEKYPKLTDEFVDMLIEDYAQLKILPTSTYANYKKLIEELYEKDLSKFHKLSKAGEFPIEYVYLLIALLICQEKTNYPSGGLFQDMLKSIKYEKLEVFKLLSSEWWK